MARQSMATTGVYTTSALLLLGVVAAAVAWSYNFRETNQALQAWGPSGVRLIRDAKHVTYVRLAEPATPGDLTQHASRHPKTDHQDISRAKGLLHLRRALLDDRSFHWQLDTDLADVRFAHVLAFHDGKLSQSVFFTKDWGILAFHRIDEAGDGPPPSPVVCSVQPIAQGLRTFFDDTVSDD